MKTSVDSSIIVSALCADDPDHEACRKVLLSRRPSVFIHAFAETFSSLTGGRLGFRIPATDAARLLRRQVAPKLARVVLPEDDIINALEESEARGVRGGAIHDYLHLVAARNVGSTRFYTLNLNDFLAFHRPGDPEILNP